MLLVLSATAWAQTLEECQRAAEQNYPLIKQYRLIALTTNLTVKNIQKEWLPQISASAQASYQSEVMAWPEGMKGMFQQMGLGMKGLAKDQYKVGIDLQQMLYDGGAISSQSKIARRQGEVQEAQNEVSLYQVRRRVNDMFFGLLLLDEQIRLNHDVEALLLSGEKQLANMVKSGTAATGDWENMQAERLGAQQQGENLRAQRMALQRVLGVFCGLEVDHLQKPMATNGQSQGNHRPELKLFDAQLQLAYAQERALRAQLRPKLGLFAQGYYGYPGLNMFEDMMTHKWGLNGIAGVRLSWNIGTLYTHKNNKAKLQLQRDAVERSREVFLFNSNLEQIQQNENINRYRNLMQSDEEIIALRTNVRKGAESKLAHGIIDINGLLREINSENAAKTQRTIHEIEMLKEIYNLKYSTNER